MIDVKALRDNPDLVRASQKARGETQLSNLKRYVQNKTLYLNQ
ncbi:MAG: Seryl-tRNA synthetase N-terminal domain [Actinomycetota bacterium]